MKHYKIVVTSSQGLSEEQKNRLTSLCSVEFFDSIPNSGDEYLKRIEGADIIFSGTAGLESAYPKLHNVYVTVSFVSVSFLDLSLMKKNNVMVSNTPGINKEAVTEWIIWMMLEIARNFTRLLNSKEKFRKNGSLPPVGMGLCGKNILILGNGNIGKQVAAVANNFGMQVNIFKRGDDLLSLTEYADFIVNTLPENSETKNLLDSRFFSSTKRGSSFISVARNQTLSLDALIESVQSGHTYKAALDFADALVGDVDNPDYLKCVDIDNILCTPHVAYSAESSMLKGNDVAIDNIEAWIKGKPQNILNP